MRGFQLENELIGLNPRYFDSIQEFFIKLKSLRLQLSKSGVQKEDSQLILSILSKLGPDLDDFASSLTREQAKLASMGMVKPSSSSQALIASHEPKDKKDSIGKRKKQKQKESSNSSSSSKGKSSRKEKNTCAYCKREGH